MEVVKPSEGTGCICETGTKTHFTGLEGLQQITLHVCYRLFWETFLCKMSHGKESSAQLILQLLHTLTHRTLHGTPMLLLAVLVRPLLVLLKVPTLELMVHSTLP